MLLTAMYTQTPNVVEEPWTNCDGTGTHFMSMGPIQSSSVELQPSFGGGFYPWTPTYFPTQGLQQFTPFFINKAFSYVCSPVDWDQWYSESYHC